MRKALYAAGLMMLVVSATATAAQAQSGATAPSTSSTEAAGASRGPGVGYGPGWGPGGMMGGYGPGYGYSHGPGMMGYGHGPGMMGGYGPGYGGGRGRGGGGGWDSGPFGTVDLTPEQQEKIAKIHEDVRRNNWNAMGQLQSERYRLRQLYNADTLDAKALDEQQRKIDDVRRQMLKSRVDAHNQTMAVLTPEQRKQVRSYGPWWMQEGAEQ